MVGDDPLLAPMRYQTAQADARAARQEWEAAGARLALAQIMERAAEIDSQHSPLSVIMSSGLCERDKLLAAVFYVRCGHLPRQVTDAHKGTPQVVT